MDIKAEVGASFSHDFRFTQADVELFARVTGDNNPLHLDPAFAANTPFKTPIIHGMLGASIFTKVLGTIYPGFGSVYLAQTLEFQRPMFVETDYEVVFTIETIDASKHVATIRGEIKNKETGKRCTVGTATLMNKEKF